MRGLSESILKYAAWLILLICLSYSYQLHAQDSVKTIRISNAQDTSKTKARKDSLSKPINFLTLKSGLQYLNRVRPDTLTRNRFLWYPLKSIEEVFNFIPGYFLKYIDVGQRQNIDYDAMDGPNTGVFRFGRPINDLIDGTFDLNILSRNEIDQIELSDGFGNFPYDFSNGINILQRQLSRTTPYSEISYWQDRYNNLYLDANFHQNFFRKLNFNFGITKHSYDGEYTNSDFDKWLGRFNFNFAFSNKVNAFLYTNYSRIQRGLNGGINPDTVDINNTSVIFDVTQAIVRNSDAYEIRERFDIDAGLMALTGKDSVSFAKLQFFESDAFRKYADEENRPNPNGILLYDNSHWINYGAKVQNLYNFRLSNQAELISNTEGELDLDLVHTNYGPITRSSRIFLFQGAGLNYRNLELNAFLKGFAYEYYRSKFETNYGLNARYKIISDSVEELGLGASYQRTVKLPSYQQFFFNAYPQRTERQELKVGADGRLTLGRVNLSFYSNKANYFDSYSVQLNQSTSTGFTASEFMRLFKFDVEGTYAQILSQSVTGAANTGLLAQEPKYSGNISVSWHDMAFKNRLEYKIGLTSRMWSAYNADFYNGLFNTFSASLPNGEKVQIPSNGTLDFYIIAKIDKAVFGLTLENILNRIIFTTGVYPYMNRGGLANVISRFNITWYFLN